MNTATAIATAVSEAIEYEKCYRTGNAVTWTAPNQPKIQLVARLYGSEDEMLIGFDVAAACVMLCMPSVDAVEAWATPSFFAAVATGAVWVDPCRQSATYAYRVIKYYARGWELFLFGFDRKEHCVMSSSTRGAEGLAGILQIEARHYRERAQLGRGRCMYALRSRYRNTSDYATTIPTDVLRWTLFNDRTRNAMGVSSAAGDFDPVDIEWKARDPGSQVTGSFNPLTTPFYTGSITPAYVT